MNVNPESCAVNQLFAASPKIYAPLRGHTGIDISCGFGSPIHAPVDMHVYKILTVNRPANDGSGFTGIFGIVDDGIELYELLIGHCDPLPMLSEGMDIRKGDLIGHEANHGLVYQNGVRITLAEQAAGNHGGAHRHVQKRPVMKSAFMSNPSLSAYNDVSGTYRDPEGNYYPIWNYGNGYNGCIDPTLSLFTHDLVIGSSGYEVFVLQRILIREGCAIFNPSGYFGALTQAAGKKFQLKYGIMGGIGNIGPITRAKIIEKYGC